MSEPVPREWRFFIDDMIASAEKVIAYTHGLDQAGFVVSGMNYDATLRNLELIGEAATHIPEDVRSALADSGGPVRRGRGLPRPLETCFRRARANRRSA